MTCLHVIKALRELDYSVMVASDHFSPTEVNEKFGMGEVLEGCEHLFLPPFRPIFPRFLALQRVSHVDKQMRKMEALKPTIAFNTQSPTLYLRNTKNLGIIYEFSEFFALHSSGQFRTDLLTSTARLPYQALVRRRLSQFEDRSKSSRMFIPLSNSLEYQLKLFDYPHTPTVFPPCDLIFSPKVKKKRVVQVTRIFPFKRLEEFMEIARRLPNYDFMIVAADTAAERLSRPTYLQKLLAERPPNVQYVEARIRSRPELLEESKVYLYTSIEPGINISAAQALGAGCVLVTPIWGGGAEMVRAAGVGYSYSNIDDAVDKVRKALEAPDASEELSEKARIFSAERFEDSIKKIVATL